MNSEQKTNWVEGNITDIKVPPKQADDPNKKKPSVSDYKYYDLSLLNGSIEKRNFKTYEDAMIKKYFRENGISINKTRGLKHTPEWKKLVLLYAPDWDLQKFSKIIKVSIKSPKYIESFITFLKRQPDVRNDYLQAVESNKETNNNLWWSVNNKGFWMDVLDFTLWNDVKLPKDLKQQEKFLKKVIGGLYADDNGAFTLPFVCTLQYLIFHNFQFLMTAYIGLTKDVDQCIDVLKHNREDLPILYQASSKEAQEKQQRVLSVLTDEEYFDYVKNNGFELKYDDETLKKIFRNISKDNYNVLNNNQDQLLRAIRSLANSQFFTHYQNSLITKKSQPPIPKKYEYLVDEFVSGASRFNSKSVFGAIGEAFGQIFDYKSTVFSKDIIPPQSVEDMEKMEREDFIFTSVTNHPELFTFVEDKTISNNFATFFTNLDQTKRETRERKFTQEALNSVVSKLNEGVFKRDSIQQKAVLSSLLQPTLTLGDAGTGKTTVIMDTMEALTDVAFDVYVMSPTGKATNVLQNKWIDLLKSKGEANSRRMISISTIHKFIGMTKFRKTYAPRVVIIDEISMVTSSLLDKLIRKISNPNSNFCNVVMFGDVKQLPPIEKGELIYSFQKATQQSGVDKFFGLNVINLQENYRQRGALGTEKTKLMPLISMFKQPTSLNEFLTSQDTPTINLMNKQQDYVDNLKETLVVGTKELDHTKSAIYLERENTEPLEDNIIPILNKEIPSLLRYFETIKNKDQLTEDQYKAALKEIIEDWCLIHPTNDGAIRVNNMIKDFMMKNVDDFKNKSVEKVSLTIDDEEPEQEYDRVYSVDFDMTPYFPKTFSNKRYSSLSVGGKIVYKGSNVYDDSFDGGFSEITKPDSTGTINISKDDGSSNSYRPPIKMARNETFVVTDIFVRGDKKVVVVESPNNKRILFENFEDPNVREDRRSFNKENDDGEQKTKEFRLGYCQTVHSSQGSEYNRCYVLIDCSKPSYIRGGSDEPFLSLNMLYTATSRAKKQTMVIVYGTSLNKQAYFDQIINFSCSERKSPLFYLLEEEIMELNLNQDQPQIIENKNEIKKKKTIGGLTC